MTRTLLTICASAALAGCGYFGGDDRAERTSAASGGQTRTAQSASQPALSASSFIQQAAMIDMAERQMAQLAQQKAQSEEVRRYAAQMLEDHGQSTQRLMRLAEQKNVTPPSSLDQQHRATAQRLEGLSGAQFDREYMQVQVQAHQKALDLYQRAAQQGTDREIQQFAQTLTPTLQQHLAEARQVVASVGGGAAAGAGAKKKSE
jgi:putative membrane protein